MWYVMHAILYSEGLSINEKSVSVQSMRAELLEVIYLISI